MFSLRCSYLNLFFQHFDGVIPLISNLHIFYSSVNYQLIVVPLRVMCLFSLADFMIYALVHIEFSNSLKVWKPLLVSLDCIGNVPQSL